MTQLGTITAMIEALRETAERCSPAGAKVVIVDWEHKLEQPGGESLRLEMRVAAPVARERPPLGPVPDFLGLAQVEERLRKVARGYLDEFGDKGTRAGIAAAVDADLMQMPIQPDVPHFMVQNAAKRVVEVWGGCILEPPALVVETRTALPQPRESWPSSFGVTPPQSQVEFYPAGMSVEEMNRFDRERVPEGIGVNPDGSVIYSGPDAYQKEAKAAAEAFAAANPGASLRAALAPFEGMPNTPETRAAISAAVEQAAWKETERKALEAIGVNPDEFTLTFLIHTHHHVSPKPVGALDWSDRPAALAPPIAEDFAAIRAGMAELEGQRDPARIRARAALAAAERTHELMPKTCWTCLGTGNLEIEGSRLMPKCEACNGKGVV